MIPSPSLICEHFCVHFNFRIIIKRVVDFPVKLFFGIPSPPAFIAYTPHATIGRAVRFEEIREVHWVCLVNRWYKWCIIFQKWKPGWWIEKSCYSLHVSVKRTDHCEDESRKLLICSWSHVHKPCKCKNGFNFFLYIQILMGSRDWSFEFDIRNVFLLLIWSKAKKLLHHFTHHTATSS